LENPIRWCSPNRWLRPRGQFRRKRSGFAGHH
jgi:hypothetical protein